MYRNGCNNSNNITMITKENLTKAHEQQLNIIINGKNVKIKAIIFDVYFVCFENSTNLKSWCYERFNELKAVIEYTKKEPKFIQGFEVKDGYKDVVMVSDNLKSWHINILKSVNNGLQPFVCGFHSWKHCRLLNKNEINEIEFID